jgi:hypothetical protein
VIVESSRSITDAPTTTANAHQIERALLRVVGVTTTGGVRVIVVVDMG